MDEDEVDMECDEGGGGAGSSSGRQAARDLGFDVDEEERRATSGTSARLAAQADEQVGVKKKGPQRRAKGRKSHGQKAKAQRERAEQERAEQEGADSGDTY